MKNFRTVKKMTLALSLGLFAINAFADVGVYNCKLVNSKKTSTLVYYPGSQSITWMPERGLKTTQANATGRSVNSGEVQFELFGFQDQADFLILPAGSSTLPVKMSIYTYHDNDGQGEDQQNFICFKN